MQDCVYDLGTFSTEVSLRRGDPQRHPDQMALVAQWLGGSAVCSHLFLPRWHRPFPREARVGFPHLSRDLRLLAGDISRLQIFRNVPASKSARYLPSFKPLWMGGVHSPQATNAWLKTRSPD